MTGPTARRSLVATPLSPPPSCSPTLPSRLSLLPHAPAVLGAIVAPVARQRPSARRGDVDWPRPGHSSHVLVSSCERWRQRSSWHSIVRLSLPEAEQGLDSTVMTGNINEAVRAVANTRRSTPTIARWRHDKPAHSSSLTPMPAPFPLTVRLLLPPLENARKPLPRPPALVPGVCQHSPQLLLRHAAHRRAGRLVKGLHSHAGQVRAGGWPSGALAAVSAEEDGLGWRRHGLHHLG